VYVLRLYLFTRCEILYFYKLNIINIKCVFEIVVHIGFQNSFLHENTLKYFFLYFSFIFEINTLKLSKNTKIIFINES
jgi:hypothetical protein